MLSTAADTRATVADTVYCTGTVRTSITPWSRLCCMYVQYRWHVRHEAVRTYIRTYVRIVDQLAWYASGVQYRYARSRVRNSQSSFNFPFTISNCDTQNSRGRFGGSRREGEKNRSSLFADGC